MSRRRDRKDAARAGRALQASRAARQRRANIVTAVAVVAVVVIGVALIAVLAQRPAGPSATAGPVDPTQLPGMQSTPAPWPPEYAHLPARLAAVRVPGNGDESYHIHAHLAVYVAGQQVPVPADVGISAADGLESPMHTHDTTGTVHIEAAQPSAAFTLGAFLDLWGVPLTTNQLGGYHDSGPSTVQAYVNGQPVTDPARYALRPHDDIVLGYGPPNSVPLTAPYAWPNGE